MLSLFVIGGCSEEILDYNNPEVKLFVKQLKAGTYNTTNEAGIVEVPNFSRRHIPELLKYIEDTSEIPSFPLTASSPQFGGKPRLGECVMWIIESIRLKHNPSMGCKLVTKNAESYDGIYFLSNEQLLEAAMLYRNWWEKVENPGSLWWSDLWVSDPLLGSSYRWW